VPVQDVIKYAQDLLSSANHKEEPKNMKRTIFEKYGGFSSVSRVVMSFYDKMLDSSVTSPFFDGIDMKRLIDHQTKFIATVMGGPASYTKEQIERVHLHLGITEPAFKESMELLRETLEDFDLLDGDIDQVIDEMNSYKHEVVKG
jgi:hemoglobin